MSTTTPPEDRTNKDYWNWRTKEFANDLATMLWADPRQPVNTKIAMQTLEGFKDCSVLDVCCGFGRLAPLFSPVSYYGFDFSEEMIALAKNKFPAYKFWVHDAHNPNGLPVCDIVVVFISLGMLEMSPAQFFELYKGLAKQAVICITSTETIIYPIYAS